MATHRQRTDWFATHNSDEDEAERDEEAGYDSEAGERRKGGNKKSRVGPLASERSRHTGSSQSEDEKDEDDDENEDENDTHLSNDEEDEDDKANDENIRHLDLDTSQLRSKHSSTNPQDEEQQHPPPKNINDNTNTTNKTAPAIHRPLTTKSITASHLASQKTGVIYISRIPPYMKPSKIRSLLSPYGRINRIFLTPEDTQRRTSRLKSGGNKKKRYTDGWVEFEDKRHAKLVAETLNTNIIGGKKGGYYHDDIWNLKYLKGFKWRHLTEQINNENAERAARLRSEISKTRKEDREFVRNVERAKMLEGMKIKRDLKRKRRGVGGGSGGGGGDDDNGDGGEEGMEGMERRRRPVLFEQKSEIGRQRQLGDKGDGDEEGERSEDVRRVLRKLF
ncbi:MAG: hypothetical protein M1823_005193 [Watsoniomyces obsoletus]|nr:MAG: hypothetical protein M1823_005193 [Watsoniomyces obsoletus]